MNEKPKSKKGTKPRLTDTCKYIIPAIVLALLIIISVAFFTIRHITSGLDGSIIFIIHISLIGLLLIACIRLQITICCCKKEIVRLKERAVTDKLTDLYNRSYLDHFLEEQLETADKTSKPVSVIMVDLDHFKEINDNNGHMVGDHVLSVFASVVLKCIRKTDIIARYGGDEFIVVLPDTDTETAWIIAERIRKDVKSAPIPPLDGTTIPSISCSVGVSTYPVHCTNKNNLIKTSDLALYEAKRCGRNRTIIYNVDSSKSAQLNLQ